MSLLASEINVDSSIVFIVFRLVGVIILTWLSVYTRLLGKNNYDVIDPDYNIVGDFCVWTID